MAADSFLSRVEIFAHIDPEILAPLEVQLRRRTFQKGEVIFHQDDPGDRLFFVSEGLVKISIVAHDGRESDIALLSPTDCFGEMTVLDSGVRSATAIAMETTETMTLSREDFFDFLTDRSDVTLQIISLLVRRLRSTDEMIGDMVFLDVPTRVGKKLLELAKMYGDADDPTAPIKVPIGQEEMSRLVGCSRETVSRDLAMYRRNGVLTTSHRRVTITDVAGLQRITTI